jgi:hypothetical protein
MLKTSYRLALITVAALSLALPGANAAERTFKAELSGAAHQPVPIATKAKGTAEFKLSADGSKLTYKVTLEDIDSPTDADLHLGPTFANGPLVVKLFPAKGSSPAPKGPFSGVLAEGTIDAGDFQGSMKGSPLSDLIDEMAAGNAYVNVHTPAHGQGEIRGQIK